MINTPWLAQVPLHGLDGVYGCSSFGLYRLRTKRQGWGLPLWRDLLANISTSTSAILCHVSHRQDFVMSWVLSSQLDLNPIISAMSAIRDPAAQSPKPKCTQDCRITPWRIHQLWVSQLLITFSIWGHHLPQLVLV